MKKLIYVLMAFIAVIIGINVSKLDGSLVFEGESSVAVISILAGLCAFVLLAILLISMKIASKIKK